MIDTFVILKLEDHFEMITKDNPDGSMDIQVAYDDEFKKAIREIYKRKRCTKKLVRKFFEDAINHVGKQYPEWDKEENS